MLEDLNLFRLALPDFVIFTEQVYIIDNPLTSVKLIAISSF